MPAPDLGGKPGVWLVHAVHGGGAWFTDDADALALWAGRGWEPADPPVEDEDLPESPAPKKTSKKTAAAAEKE
jgi:hypothetical protein